LAVKAKVEAKAESSKQAAGAKAKPKADKSEKERQKRANELEQTIADLEARLNALSHQIETARAGDVAALGTEYAKVEREMQASIDEWGKIAV
jgi:hypothetical protein